MSIKIKKNYNFLAFVNQKSVSVFKIHLNSCNYTFACIFYFGANYSLMILPCPRFFSLSLHILCFYECEVLLFFLHTCPPVRRVNALVYFCRKAKPRTRRLRAIITTDGGRLSLWREQIRRMAVQNYYRFERAFENLNERGKKKETMPFVIKFVSWPRFETI